MKNFEKPNNKENKRVFAHAENVGIVKEDALENTYNEYSEKQERLINTLDELTRKLSIPKKSKEIKELFEDISSPEYSLVVNRIKSLLKKFEETEEEAFILENKLENLVQFKDFEGTRENLGLKADYSEN